MAPKNVFTLHSFWSYFKAINNLAPWLSLTIIYKTLCSQYFQSKKAETDLLVPFMKISNEQKAFAFRERKSGMNLQSTISISKKVYRGGGGGYFTINSYGGVRRKDFCYDPIPEIWSDIDTQSQNICQILIPNRRSNKSNLKSKG